VLVGDEDSRSGFAAGLIASVHGEEGSASASCRIVHSINVVHLHSTPYFAEAGRLFGFFTILLENDRTGVS
jgi:hypothetical protein